MSAKEGVSLCVLLCRQCKHLCGRLNTCTLTYILFSFKLMVLSFSRSYAITVSLDSDYIIGTDLTHSRGRNARCQVAWFARFYFWVRSSAGAAVAAVGIFFLIDPGLSRRERRRWQRPFHSLRLEKDGALISSFANFCQLPPEPSGKSIILFRFSGWTGQFKSIRALYVFYGSLFYLPSKWIRRF